MRKLCAILISFVFFISLVDMHPAAAEDIDGISGSDVCNEDFSASEIVNGIIAGFDLGNELDCYNKVYNSSSSVSSAETWWGNPKISQEMIDTIHEEGFNAIRIPVTWYNFTSPDTYEIREDWLERVQEVVDYALKDDMYVIINMQHDTGTFGWLKATRINISENEKRFSLMWKQIAEKFKNYDERLMFEGFSEVLDKDNTWTAPSSSNASEAYDVINELNQLFVDTVRAAGYVNKNRILICNTYAAVYTENVIKHMEIPEDSVKNKLIAEVHDYEPYDFTAPDSFITYTSPADEWGSDTDKAEIKATMENLSQYFVKKGIPVIIGEFSSSDKNNEESRIKHASYFTKTALAYGIKVFWWDNGVISGTADEEIMGILNRNTLEWKHKGIADAIISNAGGNKKAAEDIINSEISIKSSFVYTGKSVEAKPSVSYGGINLVNGVDYYLTYDNNINTGIANVYVNGIGKYTGIIAAPFEILPQKAIITEFTYKENGKCILSVKNMDGVSGYQYLYAKEADMDYRPLKVLAVYSTSSSITKTFTLNKGTYYVKLRAYKTVDGVKYYGKYSASKKIIVK